MKNNSMVTETLDTLIKNKELFEDVREEIELTLDALKPLVRPGAVRIEGTKLRILATVFFSPQSK